MNPTRALGGEKLTHVASPCIQEKDRSLGDKDALVRHVPDGRARQCQSKDREIA